MELVMRRAATRPIAEPKITSWYAGNLSQLQKSSKNRPGSESVDAIMPKGPGSARFASMPSWGFGTAGRWKVSKATHETTPGPGSYCV